MHSAFLLLDSFRLVAAPARIVLTYAEKTYNVGMSEAEYHA